MFDKSAEYIPKQACEYTTEEKVAKFDKLHAFAMECWNEYVKDKRSYAFEELMQLLVVNPTREGVREFWRALNKKEHMQWG